MTEDEVRRHDGALSEERGGEDDQADPQAAQHCGDFEPPPVSGRVGAGGRLDGHGRHSRVRRAGGNKVLATVRFRGKTLDGNDTGFSGAESLMDLDTILREVDDCQASDLYLIAGAVPCMNCDGVYRAPEACHGKRLTPLVLEDFARSMMTEEQWAELLRGREMNLAFMSDGVGRFRVNILFQRGSIGMVMRRVVMEIPTLKELNLPPVLRDAALADRGIVLVTGATGSGKSTTMASMVDYRNQIMSGHIVTIEDPIEFVYRHRKSIVTQRELGMDTVSFKEALRNSLRQAPSVISIGELRDAETVQFALHAAETGHLVFATLHSTNASLTLERILHFFPGDMERQVVMQMSLNMKCVVSQRLIPRAGGGRAVACEVLINTPRCQDLISKWDLAGIREYIRAENNEGIQDFDRELYKLHKRGLVSLEDALNTAESPSELAMKMKGVGIKPGSSWEDVSDPWSEIPDPYATPESLRGHYFKDGQNVSPYTNEGAISGEGERGVSGIIPRPQFGHIVNKPSLSPGMMPRPGEVDVSAPPPGGYYRGADGQPMAAVEEKPGRPKAPPHPKARVAAGPDKVVDKYKALIDDATAPTGDSAFDSSMDELD